MAAATAKKSEIPISSKMLSWARMMAGIEIEVAAKRAGTSCERLQEWEDEDSGKKPSVPQARKLAALYGRPFLEFFLEEPPPLPEPTAIPDFRLHRGAPDPSDHRELKAIRLWAEGQRDNALGLYELLGEQPPALPENSFAKTDDDPERSAEYARALMGFELAEQIGLPKSKRDTVPVILRQKIEIMGVLTFRLNSLRKHGVRGFCVAIFPLPIIAFGQEAPTAQVFTLAHEFAHILLKTSAISGPIAHSGTSVREKKIEEWCDMFAGAFLAPQSVVNDYVPKPNNPYDEFPDDDLFDLAGKFALSPHAMLIRLTHLGYVNPDYYWRIKKAQFEEAEKNYKAFGRTAYYGSRYRGKLGDLYTSLVMEAWGAGRLTNHHAAEHMGISNLEHLNAIKENFWS